MNILYDFLHAIGDIALGILIGIWIANEDYLIEKAKKIYQKVRRQNGIDTKTKR